MQLVILAGGRATRLKLLADATPKPLVKILDKPFIFHMIPTFKKLGFRRFTFLIRSEDAQRVQFNEALSRFSGLDYELIQDTIEDGGTGKGLLDCTSHLDGKFWLVNGDSWFEYKESLSIKIQAIKESCGPVIFVADPNPGDTSNIHYANGSTQVIDYQKKGFNLELKPDSKSKLAIDFGLIFLLKNDIEKFAKHNTSENVDMGDIYKWLIKQKRLNFESIDSSYVDIGSYKGWSFLSTKLSGD